eukprot:3860417-Prymnesium_polylepis.1
MHDGPRWSHIGAGRAASRRPSRAATSSVTLHRTPKEVTFNSERAQRLALCLLDKDGCNCIEHKLDVPCVEPGDNVSVNMRHVHVVAVTVSMCDAHSCTRFRHV